MHMNTHTPQAGTERIVRRVVAEVRKALRAGRPVYVTLQSTEAPLERVRLRVLDVTHHRTGACSWLSDSHSLYPAPMWRTTVVEWATDYRS